MSVIGLRVGAFEIVGSTQVPEPGAWHLARRTGATRRQPQEALIRLLPPDADPDSREALHRQFEVIRALEDARVPEAIAFYEGLGALAITAVHGVSLEDIVIGRKDDVIVMSPTTLIDILIELADTLQRAHHRNRFHGDMSPDRVLLAADGKLWIFGFGEPLDAVPNSSWIAPERTNGSATALSDQWYLGALAAGLISGTTPWSKDGESQLESMVEPVERQWPALGRLLRQMTDIDPSQRLPSMHPVRQELLALARKAGGASNRRELGADLARPRAISIDPDASDAPNPTPTPSPLAREPEPAASTPQAPKTDLPPDGFSPSTPPPPPPALPLELPTPDVEMDLTISEEFETPAAPAFPDEDFVVVRPEVGTDVPLAALSDTPLEAIQGLGAAMVPPMPEAQPPPSPTSQPIQVKPMQAEPHQPLAMQEPEAMREPEAMQAESMQAEPSQVEPSQAEPMKPELLQAGVVFEPTDPDAHLDGGTDAIESALQRAIDDDEVDAAMQLAGAIQADSDTAYVPAEGLSWDDLAREFATDLGGGAETAVPPSSPSARAGSIDPSADLDDDASEETEHTNPRVLSGPGSEASLGIGSLDQDGEPAQLSDAVTAPGLTKVVPTPTLVGRIAPIAAGVFVLFWALWFLTWLF